MTGESSDADTSGSDYAHRLARLEEVWWRRLVPVQLPYTVHLKSLRLGRTLDVGCGIGRNLKNLQAGSLGVDHNADSVGIARARGLDAYTVPQLEALPQDQASGFDALLFAHVLEHLGEQQGANLLASYLPRLRPGGRVALITPQEKGYTTDSTHVRFMDFLALSVLVRSQGLQVDGSYSFPLPRVAGRVFPYNEFVMRARKPA